MHIYYYKDRKYPGRPSPGVPLAFLFHKGIYKTDGKDIFFVYGDGQTHSMSQSQKGLQPVKTRRLPMQVIENYKNSFIQNLISKRKYKDKACLIRSNQIHFLYEVH